MAQVQARGGDNGAGGTTLQFTSITSTGAGNFLCIVFGCGSNMTITGVTDNLTQTWSKFSVDEDGTKTHCWYKENSASGVTTVTVTFPSSNDSTGVFMERNDILTSASADIESTQNTAVAGAGPLWTSNATGTMAQNHELGIAWAYQLNGQPYFDNAGSGWTAITGTGITNGEAVNAGGESIFVELQEFTAGGTATATGTCPDTTTTLYSRVALFKLAASAQTAAPTSTISSGSWTPSTGATLYGTIDEAVADDADYDVDTSAGSTMEVKFATLTDPAVSTGHVVRYRISGESGTLTVSLRQGASTEIAAWAHTPPPATPTTFNQTLSGAQADSITDYTDLRLRVVSS
jgi:hypothetical protein